MRSLRWLWAAAWVLVPAAIGACAALSDVPAGMCGNGVVEQGEDCDQTDHTNCGAPGSPGACRWICVPGADAVCPAGWGCGFDGICRTAAEPRTWSTRLAVPGGNASDIIAADLDGDDVPDVVTVSPGVVSATYFERSRAATPGGQIMAQDAHAAVGGLISKTSPHIVVTPVSDGVGAFQATTDRALLAAAFATITFDPTIAPAIGLAPMRSYADGVEIPALSFYAYVPSLLVTFDATRPPNKGPNWLKDLPKIPLPDTRVGDPVVGRFDLGRPCGQIAFGLVDAAQRGHVAVFAGCNKDDEKKTIDALADVSLPPGVHMCSSCQPVHLWDVDGDHNTDVIVVDDKNAAHVAYGDGTGHFRSSPVGGTLDVTGPGLALPPTVTTPPLRIADFNRDCSLDFVLPSSILVSTGAAQSCAGGAVDAPDYFDAAVDVLPHEWTEAAIADLNGDGLADLVLSSSKHVGLSVFLGTGTPLFNRFSIVTQGQTHGLAIGDFDGDFIPDVAYAEKGLPDPDSPTFTEVMQVAFGGSDGVPGSAIAIGEVGTAMQVSALRSPAPIPDLASDLFVLAQHADKSLSMYLFPGVGTRQPNASYYFVGGSDPVNDFDVPRRAVVGSFSDPGGNGDIAVFARHSGNGSARLWLLHTGDDASVIPTNATGAPKPIELPAALGSAEDLLLASVTYPGRPEMLAIAAPGSGGATFLTTTTAASLQTFAKPLDPKALQAFDLTPGDGTSKIVGQMITARVQSKDKLDLVLVSPTSGLAVVPCDESTGEVDVTTPGHALSVDELRASCREGADASTADVASVAAFKPGALGLQKLMVVFPGGAYVVEWDGKKLVPACASGGKLGINGGKAVAVGDFDGDGVEDIIVSRRTGLTVHYSDPRAPAPLTDGDAGVGGAQ